MDIISLNIKHQLTILLSILLLNSCGPRTGIHEDSNAIETVDVCDTVSIHQTNSRPDGSRLFKVYCAVCHSAQTDQKITGPGLRGIADRLPKPAEDYFINYTLDNFKVYKSGDTYAKTLKQSGWTLMPTFDSLLTVEDVRSIYWFLTRPAATQR